MIILKHSAELQAYLHEKRRDGVSIGFVPTMGALHGGHISLLKASRKSCGLTICSIYVNELQFNNQEDYLKYPNLVDTDIMQLEEQDCDVLFLPGDKEIYPEDKDKDRVFDLGHLENVLEGKFRPGHFQGVCKVVARLLEIVQPHKMFLGRKDYQQTLVIRKLAGLLHNKVEIETIPTLRESNGLAMSSRNMRLSEEEREKAALLYKSLIQLSNKILNGTFGEINHELNSAKTSLQQAGFQPDYLEIANPENLLPIDGNYQSEDVVILVAAYLNDVRLIDNLHVAEGA